MTITPKNIIPSKIAEATSHQQYISAVGRCIIDTFTITNVSAATANISIYISPSGGGAVNDHLILKNKSIKAGATYVANQLIGSVLELNDSIYTEASAVDSLVISASGREII